MVSREEVDLAAKDLFALSSAIREDNRIVVVCAIVMRAAERDNPQLAARLWQKAFEIEDEIEAQARNNGAPIPRRANGQ